MYEIYEVRFEVEFGCGYDTWRIFGDCPDHPVSKSGNSIKPSVPVSYNADKDVFTTKSGSVYQIMNYSMNKEKFIEEIEKCISLGYYENI